MQVSRLEIFGFKSFMDRLILPLGGGITGVVGPNGCGKSNVVDALRWVLGETRAKSLRGGTLEDVIFNGTDQLRPLGLAEVTITLRAAQDDFFADLVSPALEAELAAEAAQEMELEELGVEDLDGESEGNEGDQVEGEEEEGKPRLTVISGDLDTESTEDEPVEEEAAPEAPSQADSKLAHQFSWLRSTSEVQVTRRLYRSGESEYFINRVPCRLKDLKEIFRAVGLGARAYTIVAQGEVSRIITSKPEERRIILEEAAGVQGFRDKIAASKRRLADTEVNISRLEDIIKEVQRQVSSLKRQATRARNRQELKTELARMEKQLFADELSRFSSEGEGAANKLKEAQQAEAEIEAKLRKEQSEEEQARGELIKVDIETDELRSKIDAMREELSNRMRQRGEKRGRMSELGALIAAHKDEIKRGEERVELLRNRKSEVEKEITQLKEEENRLARELGQLDSAGSQKLETLQSELDRNRQTLKEHDHRVQEIRDELVATESVCRSLREQVESASVNDVLRSVIASNAELADLMEEGKALVDCFSIPLQYEQAVQAVLNEQAGYLVVPDVAKVVRALSSVGALNKEGASVGMFEARTSGNNGKGGANVPFARLVDRLEVRPAYVGIIECLLGHIYIVDTVTEAQEFYARSGETDSDVVCVTLRGEVVTSYSFSNTSQESGLVLLKSRVKDLEEEVVQCREREAVAQEEREQIKSLLSRLEAEYKAELGNLQEQQTQSRALGREQGSVRGKLQASQRSVEQVGEDIDRVVHQIRVSESNIGECTREQLSLQQEMAALVSEGDEELEKQVKELQAQYESLDTVRRSGRDSLSTYAAQVERTRRALDESRVAVSNCMLEQQKLGLDAEHLKEKIVTHYGEEALVELGSVESPELEEETRQQYRDEVARIRTRIAREGDVDFGSIAQLEEEQERLDSLSGQKDDLTEAASSLVKTITRLTEIAEKRFMQTFHAVNENFARLVPELFGGGRGSLELTDPSKPFESGLEIVARPPGKKLKSIELLSGGEKALCATALIFAMFLVRPSPLCVLDEVDAPLDDANLGRFLKLVKEMSGKTQFLMITHNKLSMATADTLIGVTMEQPGASKTISVSLQEAYSQVA